MTNRSTTGAPSQHGLALTPAEREDFEERAAIMQHEGGLTREQAEQAAAERMRVLRERTKEALRDSVRRKKC